MISGVLNILKPPGMTSHDVVSFIRRIYGIKRVGHAGTLDPAAAGVLPVFIGNATRLIEYTTNDDKSYRAEVTFGYETDTADDTGRITYTAIDCAVPEPSRIEQVLVSFLGEITQIPPIYSAIKVGGKKLYELARAGVDVEPKPRNIIIYDISLVKANYHKLLFDVTCSKGTYIRSLCVDIGKKLGCPAVMSFLVRTRVGQFFLENSWTIEEIAAAKEEAILPADRVLTIPSVVLTPDEAKAICNGRSVPYAYNHEIQVLKQSVKIYDQSNTFIGIGLLFKKTEGQHVLSPVKVLN
ncbi:MAG TPA: tRNA pseudouridine(55) synthase TruB [Methylomusa anaerophila]|uniref:tRNA pseudouridine synthase B n=1 Tax=Methylomusa anaerophila TaxID=1930071 RepID=A0A348APY6_9FIRM|nr:tRNA pseudouridine(55) synthase TruB [Methylomusa anaerophila]BBB93134.1 tRNA pseudouridine synthase B [Methylomusa anaerophila]HML87033.1 tRNA pseudouridine(55) synthase TruB [Methylomusa anaerophila]